MQLEMNLQKTYKQYIVQQCTSQLHRGKTAAGNTELLSPVHEVKKHYSLFWSITNQKKNKLLLPLAPRVQKPKDGQLATVQDKKKNNKSCQKPLLIKMAID